MKLICERDAFRAALSHVAGRARSKTKIPILQHVLLSATISNRLSLTTTDLDARCVCTCAAEVSEASDTTVSADRLTRLIDGMPQGAQVTLHLKGSDLHVECGRSKYKLPTLPAADFPEMDCVEDGTDITLKAADAKRIFTDAFAALPANDSRIMLFGGHLSQSKGGLMLTGCDGIRLVRLTLPNEAKLSRGYIIPKPVMPELVKLAAIGDLRLRCNDRLIEVTSGNVVLTSKLIQSEYPDMERVIPALQDGFVEVDRSEFMAAFKRLAGIEGDNSTLNLRWVTDESAVEMSLSGEGTGTESVTCKCTASSGEIAFKPGILGSMLDVVKGELLRLHPSDMNGPLRIVDPADASLTVVAMPCRAVR